MSLAREPVEPGALWVRWESPRLPREGLGEEEARRRERAEALFAELAGRAPEKRCWALKERRFRDPALVELLLEKSREAQLADPGEADGLATMAALLALRLCEPGENAALMAVFLGRASCLSGNARRLLVNEAEAELAFANTVSFLAARPDRATGRSIAAGSRSCAGSRGGSTRRPRCCITPRGSSRRTGPVPRRASRWRSSACCTWRRGTRSGRCRCCAGRGSEPTPGAGPGWRCGRGWPWRWRSPSSAISGRPAG